MSPKDLIKSVDDFLAHGHEKEWVEFKLNEIDPIQLGKYISGLANAANIAGESHAYLIFGINNETYEIQGTQFDPLKSKARGNQDLLPWLSSQLNPNPGFDPAMIPHPQGKLVVFVIGRARLQPVEFQGTAWIRIGTSLTELNKHPEKARLLWTRSHDWSAEICPGATLLDLDPEAIEMARQQFSIKHPRQAEEIQQWDDLTFLNKAKVLRQGQLTNTAVLLLGKPETASFISPAVAKVSWILKDLENKELDYEHFGPPLLLAGERLLKRIRNLTVRTLPGGTLFPQEVSQYDPWVIREALHNCIAHQDYTMNARIAVVEYPDRIILTNAGSFLPGSIETVIHQDAPQLQYRNPFLSDSMVELNMIDTQGGGIKRMFETQRRRWFPLPDYDFSQISSVTVSLSGQILDEAYTRLLMENTSLTLDLVMLLDRVQKRKPIERAEALKLKNVGLIEGRYPNLIVAAEIAKAVGDEARHTREKGLSRKFYMEMILTLVKDHWPVDRKAIDHLLLSKLPERHSQVQKEKMIHNLLQRLRREGLIDNVGTRSQPQWVPKESKK